jgi:hypothetical protein
MPTVLRLRRLRVVIYPNDHRPAHVHVIGNGCEAVFALPEWAARAARELRVQHQGLTRLKADLAAKLTDLCGSWESIHGEP